ncbi:MAG: CDP-glucose 4,6-dehydratase [Candidatus Melainabacteria bacterium GWF2_37_15]|nr:MAG: CDP-glucose 4,6-dehydratase [Candidatus Melainabacteria bacterium GWF2_37_15]
MNKNFWKGKRVFVTGHTGFKGSWLTLWLLKMGAEVCGYSLEPPFKPNLFELAQLKNCISHFNEDIRDLESLKRALNLFKPDIVFHMAAQSLVRISYKSPVETFDTNVMGTINLLESIRNTESVKVCVNITSDKCYENRETGTPFVEGDPMGGYDPYSCSKGCAELVTTAYRKSFLQDIGIATVRAGNVIGGGDWSEDRLIPDIIKSILNKKEIIIRNPDAIRPWQHVLEPLRGYLMLAEALWADNKVFSQGWNFGPENSDALPVHMITQKIIDLWGNHYSWKPDVNANPHEASYLRLNCSLAKIRLNWKPVFNIDKSLLYTVEWYKMYEKNENMYEYTLKQVEEYEKMPLLQH